MQYKVPQKIDLADKIIGPLTLMQFIYLMAGGMIFYVAMNISSTVLLLVGFPAAFLALALAFIKIQDQPFSKFLIALLFYIFRAKERYWYKDIGKEKFTAEMETKEKTKKEVKVAVRKVEKSELEKLAQSLDVQAWKNIQEKDKPQGEQKNQRLKTEDGKLGNKGTQLRQGYAEQAKKQEVVDIFNN